ncbi:hypothetical protein J6590_004651 [Homalodisca vitripennis]|nr:hypothetical protein J6590_004651 [Homalodisca vitripennis]
MQRGAAALIRMHTDVRDPRSGAATCPRYLQLSLIVRIKADRSTLRQSRMILGLSVLSSPNGAGHSPTLLVPAEDKARPGRRAGARRAHGDNNNHQRAESWASTPLTPN